MTDAYVKEARQEIMAWEKGERDSNSSWSRFSNFAINPAARLTARMVPSAVQQATTQVIEKTLRLAAHSGKFSVNTKAIHRERTLRLGRKKALGARLKVCDDLAAKFWSTHRTYAAVEGAATGFGLGGAFADLPLILGIAIRAIKSISLCYGFDTAGPAETDYALHILRLTSSDREKEWKDIQLQIKKMERSLDFKSRKTARVEYLMSIEQYAKSMAVGFIQRKALQMIPLAGVVTGASSNMLYAHEAGRAAYMCYRRRFINEQLKVASAPQGKIARKKT
jgi:hypothetical protein